MSKDKEITSIPEAYEGPFDSPIKGTLTDIGSVSSKRGLLVLHFATEFGPLPLYAFGYSDDTRMILRSNALKKIGFSASDIGKDFSIKAGRKKKANGDYGKPGVISIERPPNVAPMKPKGKK